MFEQTMQMLQAMLEHGNPEHSDDMATAMIGAAYSYFWNRRGEAATIEMMDAYVANVRAVAATGEAARPIGVALN